MVGNHAEIWDTVSHKLLAALPTVEWVTDISFTPDGHSLAVGGRSTSTSVWSVSDSAARIQLSGFESRPTSMAFSPDGCLAIGTSNGEISLYRNGDNRCTTSSPVSTTPVEPSTRNPDRERDRSRRTSVMYDATGRLIAHDWRGLRIWQTGSAVCQAPSLIPMPGNSRSPWGSQTLLARTADGQTMALVRPLGIALWQAAHPDRFRLVVIPPTSPGEEPSPFLRPPPPPPTGATAGRSPGPRFEGRGQPEGAQPQHLPPAPQRDSTRPQERPDLHARHAR